MEASSTLNPVVLGTFALPLLFFLIFFFNFFPGKGKTIRKFPAGSSSAVQHILDLPSPSSWPVLGNLLEITRKGYHICHVEWLREYGEMFTYRMGPYPVLVIANPALVRTFTMLQFKTFHDRPSPPTAAPTSEKGIVFAKGNYWAGLRASLTPSFHNDANVAALYTHMLHCTSRLLLKLHGQCKGRTGEGREEVDKMGSVSAAPDVVDILPLLDATALDVIGMTCFGAQHWHKSTESSPSNETSTQALSPAEAYSTLEELTSQLGPFTRLLLLITPGPLRNALRLALSWIPGLGVGKANELRRALFTEWQLQVQSRKGSLEAESAISKDLIAPLTRAKVKGTSESLTDSDITSALFTLIGAATNTTTTTVACALFYLAQRPEAQEIAAAEARSFLKGPPISPEQLSADATLQSLPTIEDLARMPYITAVVKEALRLSSPGAIVARTALEDTVVGNCFIPKGTPVIAPVYAIHRSEKYFPRPNEFFPERFLDESTQASLGLPRDSGNGSVWGPCSEEAYFPFGMGPRMCLGYKYATIEAKLFLASILGKFNVGLKERNQVLQMDAGFTLRPLHGMPLAFKEVI